ncbi:tRNA lysidine(34) synthetase TilS [Georgenia sp. 311]|uniref:tRNA lysidine(34) synthetase TilS n=1 Tax=Georgenia sp. 311 TaxID=2585134 RepID=UPI001111BE58|nr:tRNA lysidine(34) synthetase TilS [Georgenia sp. 311]TNC16944.1 tRNA lysidine(34) synthetase TilS [Georgenia sp. 311]
MAGPAPAVAAARVAVRAALADLPAGALVLVACSGGADSLALAAATAFVAPRAGLRAGAVVVDHGLAPGSDDVAARAAATCAGLGLEPVEVRAVDVGTEGGPEAAARTARYAALAEAADAHGAAAVLLGHTLDDQAETVLLGLGRGSGARSLAGMAPVTGRWRRPFLALRRRDTEACCTALGLEWVTDVTNAPDGPWRRADGGPLRRSAVRHDVMPALEAALGPGVAQALARTARLLREDDDYLTRAAADLAARAGLGEDGEVDLDVAELAAEHPALRGRVLHLAATAAGCPPGALAAVHVAALDALVTHYHGQGALDLPGAVTAVRRCGRLNLSPPRSARGQ